MKNILVLCIATMALISCGENKKKNQPEIKTVETAVEIHKPAELQAEFKDSLIGETYKNYNILKSALVNSDVEKTQIAARHLEETLKRFEYSEALKQMAEKIASVSDLETQREVFQYLTEEMTKLVEGNLKSGNLYVQYCPMAFQGKGAYWLSNGKEIRNPYFGDKMLKCGEVKRMIE